MVSSPSAFVANRRPVSHRRPWISQGRDDPDRRSAPYPWCDGRPDTPDRGDVGPGIEPRGAPVGRRVLLGLVGLGAAGRAARRRTRRTGSSARSARSSRRTAPASRRCSRSAASASTPSPAACPSRSRADYRLRVHGLVDEDRHALATTTWSRCTPTSTHARLPVRHRLAGARRAVEGRAPRRRPRPRRRAAGRARACASRRSTARTPRASRSSRPGATT